MASHSYNNDVGRKRERERQGEREIRQGKTLIRSAANFCKLLMQTLSDMEFLEVFSNFINSVKIQLKKINI